MTDAVEDLAAWLTQIWDEEERLAKRAGDALTTPEIDNYGHLTVPSAWMLARIAADRKILELHMPNSELCFWTNMSPETHEGYGRECFPDGSFVCETLGLLAHPYADRPGFRPDWSVERQGVEW